MKMEVMYVMAHLLITLSILGVYAVTLLKGNPDTTLQNLLLIVGGYWFGAMGAGMIKKTTQQQSNTDEGVK